MSITPDMSYDTNIAGLYSALLSGCPWLRDNIDIVDEDRVYFKEDGIDYAIYFNRMERGMEQYIIHSSYDNPLDGNDV